jgi:UDP-GlcNAc:undecaprenyl-phosphate/decaprenyl-phosphate GlcNAc-1-phosphate transferase
MALALLFAPAAAAALISYLLTPLAGQLAVWLGALDQPGPRKIHRHPIPRLGGLAVIASALLVAIAVRWLMPASVLMPRLFLGLVLGLLPIVIVSIRDDIKPLSSGPKFAAHILGASTAVALGVSLHPDIHLFGQTVTIGWLALPLSVLWLVGTTNAFNIVDGLDGLSAGLGLISACGLCGVFLFVNENTMAGAALVVAGAIAGFLPYNIFPARMFFGDTGATAIGFCLGVFALRGGATLSAGFAAILPVFVLGMPVAETLISMARRGVRRLERRDAGGMFEADRNHMHHRLLALGIDHPRAVLILYGAGGVLGAAALLSTLLSAGESALLVMALLLAGFMGVQRLGYDEFAIIRNGMALRAYDAPVLRKSMFAVFVDLIIVAIAAVAAVALKTDWNLMAHRAEALGMIAALAPVTIVVFWRMGLYRGTWRLAGIDDFVRASCGVLVASLLSMTVRMLLTLSVPSVSLFSIYALAAVIFVTGSRASYQILAASRWRVARTGLPTLIYGAGRKGASALRELAADPAATLRPVAFIDDDVSRDGRIMGGIPIVGSLQTIEQAIRRFGIRAVIVAFDALPDLRLVELGDLCERAGISLFRMRLSLDSVDADSLFEPPAVTATATASAMAMAMPPQAPLPQPLQVRFEDARALGTIVPAVATECCPKCGSLALHRSHVRKMTERLRKRLTEKRLFRCEGCGWRGWNHIIDPAAYGPFPIAAAPLSTAQPS